MTVKGVKGLLEMIEDEDEDKDEDEKRWANTVSTSHNRW